MRNGDILAGLAVFVAQVTGQAATDPLGILIEFLKAGVLGAIIAWLFFERWQERKLDRGARHRHAEMLQDNTAAVDRLRGAVRENSGLMHLTLGHLGHRLPPLLEEDPPAPAGAREAETR
jgi:uncharacterized membrane protein YccC